MSLWISFCYRIYQEMVRPLFRKCCPKNQNKVDIESNESQIIPPMQNQSQTDCGPKINPQKCKALVQVALAETVNDFGSTDLGKLSTIINSVEFQNFMDQLMEFVKNISQEHLTHTVNSNNQLPSLQNTEEINVELKKRIHDKIFYLGDKTLTPIANHTTEQAHGVTLRATIGSTSASIVETDEQKPESDTTVDGGDSVFPLLSKIIDNPHRINLPSPRGPRPSGAYFPIIEFFCHWKRGQGRFILFEQIIPYAVINQLN